MVVTILCFITMYLFLMLMYVSMKKTGEAKDGYSFGTIMKQEWMQDEDVVKICGSFQRQLKILTVFLALVPLIVLILPGDSLGFTVWVLWIFALFFLSGVLYAKANRQMRELKERRGWRQMLGTADDDSHWRWGMFYYNKDDSHRIVNARAGTGTTMNLATPLGKVMEVFYALCILVPLTMCAWMILEEYTPMRLYVADETLTAEQIRVNYEIPINDMEQIMLIEELPHWSKVDGSSMKNLCKGTYYIRNEGRCEVFVNPQNEVFIEFQDGLGKTYYMSAADDDATLALVEELKTLGAVIQ